MSREFLNEEEKRKIESIEIFSQMDKREYNNRFDRFSSEIEIIGWDEIEQWVNSLSKVAKKYKGIFGIPKGGLIIAILLSYKTKLPLLSAPCKGCLVVDDDMSTGLTLLPYYNRYDTAVMYKNPNCPISPTYLFSEYGETYKEFIWNKGAGE